MVADHADLRLSVLPASQSLLEPYREQTSGSIITPATTHCSMDDPQNCPVKEHSQQTTLLVPH